MKRIKDLTTLEVGNLYPVTYDMEPTKVFYVMYESVIDGKGKFINIYGDNSFDFYSFDIHEWELQDQAKGDKRCIFADFYPSIGKMEPCEDMLDYKKPFIDLCPEFFI